MIGKKPLCGPLVSNNPGCIFSQWLCLIGIACGGCWRMCCPRDCPRTISQSNFLVACQITTESPHWWILSLSDWKCNVKCSRTNSIKPCGAFQFKALVAPRARGLDISLSGIARTSLLKACKRILTSDSFFWYQEIWLYFNQALSCT